VDKKIAGGPVIRGIEFEDAFFECVAEESVCESKDTRRLADSRHSLPSAIFSLPVVYRYNDMRHISVPSDDLKTFYRLDIPHDIIQLRGAILLDPRSSERLQNLRGLPRQFVSCACSRVLGSLCLSCGRCRRLCACRHHREDAMLFVRGGGKSGEAYVTERVQIGTKLGTRHARKKSCPPPRHRRSRWSIQRVRILSLTRGQPLLSCLVWMEKCMWLIVDAACKDGTPDVSTDFTVPQTFEAALSDPAQIQKVSAHSDTMLILDSPT
jgi:hypothetical protein